MRRHPRCTSRLWTPEHGADSWLTCVRRDEHRGEHRAAAERWNSREAMGSPDSDRPVLLPTIHMHLLRRRHHADAGRGHLKAG